MLGVFLRQSRDQCGNSIHVNHSKEYSCKMPRLWWFEDSDSDSDKVTRLFGSDMTVPRGLQISDDSFVVASATWQAYDQIICILYEN